MCFFWQTCVFFFWMLRFAMFGFLNTIWHNSRCWRAFKSVGFRFFALRGPYKCFVIVFNPLCCLSSHSDTLQTLPARHTRYHLKVATHMARYARVACLMLFRDCKCFFIIVTYMTLYAYKQLCGVCSNSKVIKWVSPRNVPCTRYVDLINEPV